MTSQPAAVPGVVAGGLRILLRLEGAAVFAVALLAFAFAGESWRLFALLFFAPDLAMVGYLAGPRAGAVAYNMLHSYAGPALLVFLMAGGVLPVIWSVCLIWIAHIGFDRALGYGLKYGTAFGDTHLGQLGRRRQRDRIDAAG